VPDTPDEAPGLSLADMAAAALAFLIPVGYLTAVTAPFWTVKAVLILVAIPVGLVCLVGLLAHEHDRAPAIAGLGFLSVALLSVVFSDNPHLAFFGGYARGTGWLFIAGLLALWAIGRTVTEQGARVVSLALGAAIVVNAAVCIAQHLTNLEAYSLALFDGRATGLVGNPVHVATLFAGGTFLAVSAFRQSFGWGVVLVACAAGVQASGSRFALAGLVVAAAWGLVRGRHLRAVAMVGLLAAGAAIGTVAVGSTDGASSSSRVAQGVGDNSTKQRLYTWRSAVTAVSKKPVLGNGPGRYVTGAERYRPLELVRSGNDSFFDDAHNIIVEYAVTTGLAGVTALAAFALLAFRRARGPLAAFALGAGGMLLVQPLHVGTVPLAFLALGAAGPPVVLAWSRIRMLIGAVGTAGAVAAGGMLVAGDARLREAQLAYSPEDAASAGRLLPRWPQLPRAIAAMHVFYAESQNEPARYDRAVAANRDEVDRDRPDPRVWEDLGAILFKVGDVDGAEAAYRAAIARNPMRISATIGLARVAVANEDFDEARRHTERVAHLQGLDDDGRRELLGQIDAAEERASEDAQSADATMGGP
ncbi:MAG TPA: O-antigen ligase family protein, partial [Acidimicrobiales bacterium]